MSSILLYTVIVNPNIFDSIKVRLTLVVSLHNKSIYMLRILIIIIITDFKWTKQFLVVEE